MSTSTLLTQMTDICSYLWEVTKINKKAERSEIHLPADVFDKLKFDLNQVSMVTAYSSVPSDELRISGVLIKRMRE